MSRNAYCSASTRQQSKRRKTFSLLALPLAVLCAPAATSAFGQFSKSQTLTLPHNVQTVTDQRIAVKSGSTTLQNPGAGPDFYVDTDRGVPHQVAFFYSGVAQKDYRLEFGDGSSELMAFHYPTDCFPQIQRTRTPCPNYWAFHTYRSAGSYVSNVKDSSGTTLRTITIQVP